MNYIVFFYRKMFPHRTGHTRMSYFQLFASTKIGYITSKIAITISPRVVVVHTTIIAVQTYDNNNLRLLYTRSPGVFCIPGTDFRMYFARVHRPKCGSLLQCSDTNLDTYNGPHTARAGGRRRTNETNNNVYFVGRLFRCTSAGKRFLKNVYKHGSGQ